MAEIGISCLEFYEVPVSLILWSAEVLPNGIRNLCCINYSFKFCVISKVAEVALCPITHIVNEDVKLYWTQYPPLVHSTGEWPARLHATHYNHLRPLFLPVSRPPSCPLICCIWEWIVFESFQKKVVNTNDCSLLIHKDSISSWELSGMVSSS